MIRNLKALGLALVAMLALGAFGAAQASAVTDVFTSKVNPETVTGTSHDNVFEITGVGKVECTTSKFHGSIPNNATQATITAEYSGEIGKVPHTTDCSSAFGPARVTMNGCDYDFTGETSGLDEGKADATVWVTCPPEKQIEIDLTNVGTTLKIHAQTPTSGGVTYTNNTPVAGQVTVHATATGITYSCAPHFLCTLGGVPTEGNDADYTGTVVMHGKNGAIEFS